MRSIRTKITLLTMIAIIIALSVTTVVAVADIKELGENSSEQILMLLCETGAKNLNVRFGSVQQSVNTVSSFAEDDLKTNGDEDLSGHMARVEQLFENTAENTIGILTYYYRIDPAYTRSEKGFWYVNLDGEGFKPHEVTDIEEYATGGDSGLEWFTVPKTTGKSIWLPPYSTANLDIYVLSYNVPVYKDGVFVGVIGIEIDYETFVDPVDSITLYQNGYAFINDEEGNIIYHPKMSVDSFIGENAPAVPVGLITDEPFLKYTFRGVEKLAVWKPLNNGMRFNVTVPVAEIDDGWRHLIHQILFVAAFLLVVAAVVTLRVAGGITRPLRRLTEAAEQVDAGNFDFVPEYDSKDEVGKLTHTFGRLTTHLRTYISELNSLAYTDALTSVHNKGAFDICVREMQSRISDFGEKPEFAVGVFDCDNLKAVNDRHGHDEGDSYLQTASALICGVFRHSPVFRIGGDEFAVILQNEDYRARDELLEKFKARNADLCKKSGSNWEHAGVACGIAVYDPKTDPEVSSVVRRADMLMYENKRTRKAEYSSEPTSPPPEYPENKNDAAEGGT